MTEAGRDPPITPHSTPPSSLRLEPVQHVQQLRHLNELARLVSSTLDLDSVCQLVVRRVPELLGGERCAIVRYDDVTETFGYVALWHRGRHAPPGEGPLPAAGSVPAEVLRTGRAYVANDTSADARPPLPRLAALGIGSHVSAPILVGNRRWGTLSVGFERPGGGTEERVELLLTTASHVAVAIKNAELYTSLQRANEELRATQQQTVRQERLRALGHMASGVAHDLNNALSPVVGFSELLLAEPKTLDDKETLRRYLELIYAGGQDAARVVYRLREFYRQRDEAEPFAAVDLNEVVRQAIALSEPKWRSEALAAGKMLTVLADLAPLPPVTGNDADLREALVNLLFNAADAMPRDGTITVRTRAAENACVLEVADEGAGMTEEVRLRCLEPFFTTKGEHGTGLGLAMVYGVVQRHNGAIDIQSAVGEGTTVSITLPVHNEMAVPDTGGQVAPAERARVALRVLVVDDDALVREVTAAHLLADGHAVTLATNGAEALARLEEGRFDLVLTDRAMPGMSGDQLAAAIKAREASLPVILLSGFGDLMQAAGETPPGVDAVLGKPVSGNRLRQAVAAVLAATAGANRATEAG